MLGFVVVVQWKIVLKFLMIFALKKFLFPAKMLPKTMFFSSGPLVCTRKSVLGKHFSAKKILKQVFTIAFQAPK